MRLPPLLETLNPGIVYRGPAGNKTLYLTLDDGPSDATRTILGVLRRHNVHATFFIITDHIDPMILQEIVAAGHQLAHHMKTSAALSKMDEARFESEFLAAEKALAPFGTAKLFRPPGGSISARQAHFVQDRGYSIVVGTVFPLDHWLENKSIIVALARLLTIDGGILILHDTPTRGPRTAAVLDELIPQLRRAGYQFAPLPTNFLKS